MFQFSISFRNFIGKYTHFARSTMSVLLVVAINLSKSLSVGQLQKISFKEFSPKTFIHRADKQKVVLIFERTL